MQEKRKTQRQGEMLSRRDFVGGAAAVAAFTVVPRHVLGGAGNTPPSEKLNIAGVGVGGMGQNNIAKCAEAGANIVALCDVDSKYSAGVFKKYPKAHMWTDFRKMLDEQKDIDAVVVATPDHLHTVVAMAADTHRVGGPHVDGGRPKVQGADPDGQPGPLQRGGEAGLRMDPGRGDR